MLMAMPEVGHVSQREAGQQSFGRNFPTILSVAEQIFPDLVAHCLRGATVICNDYCSFLVLVATKLYRVPSDRYHTLQKQIEMWEN